ncbi:MAG: hypothetical protein HY985_12920, partial [Magnetospirillum sp.]|nr:hypothetical protein [Magnetospirillum sp.]
MIKMGKMVCATVAVLVLQGCQTAKVTYRDVSPRVIAQKEGSQFLQQLAIDGKKPLLLLISNLYNESGSLAMCGAARVLGAEDLSAVVWEAMRTEGSSLTIQPKDGRGPVVLTPKFIPVTFQR